jgi:hypothetical protein
MSVINTSTQINNLVPLPPSPIQNSNVGSNLYLGSGTANLPGMTNVYYAPSNLIEGIKALFAAQKIGDREGIVENTLRIAEAPFSFSNGFMQCIYNALHAGVYFKFLDHPGFHFALSTTGPLSLVIAIFGFAFCVFEGALETFGLVRTTDFFINNYPFEIEDLKEAMQENDPQKRQIKFSSCMEKILKLPLPAELINEINSFIQRNDLNASEFLEMVKQISDKIETNTYLTQLNKLNQNYFQISADEENDINNYVQTRLSALSPEEQNARKSKILQNTLDTKKSELVRKIHPWLADEIQSSLPDVIRDLASPSQSKQAEAKEKAEALFANIKTQSKKKILTHTIGAVAVLFTIAGLIAACISCPIIIPFVLLGIGTLLAFARGGVHWGFMNTRGWNFSAKDCYEGFVSESIREFFDKKTENNEYELKPLRRNVLKYVIPPGPKVISAKRAYKNSLLALDFTLSSV